MNLRTVSTALLWIGFHFLGLACGDTQDVDNGASCEEAKRNLDAHRDSLNHCETDDDCTVVGSARSSCECGSTSLMALNTEERAKFSNTLDVVFSAECGSGGGQECDDYGDYGAVQCREGRCGWPDYSHVTCNFGGVCNPVTQAGCAGDEKCAQIVLIAEPFLGQIVCIPDGVVAAGEACELGEPGRDTGFDNCQAGLDCFAGVCAEICSSAPDSCRPTELPFDQGEYCTADIQNHFNSTTGICSTACDPTDDTVSQGVVVNAGCSAAESCGFNAIAVTTSCAATPAQSVTQTQNEIPHGPGPDRSFRMDARPVSLRYYAQRLALSWENHNVLVFARQAIPI